MAAFAAPADLILRYDVRTLGDLCSDDGTRVTQANLATDQKVEMALDTATGQIMAAVLRGERYTAADLAALTSESADYLKDLTCRIAFWLLWQRKPYTDDKQRMEAKESSDKALEMLRTGQHIFDIAATIEATKPDVETVTRVEVADEWGLFVDRARGRFYPSRRTYRDR
jgi:hypothetical protein